MTDRTKSLEALEQKVWPEPEFQSYVIRTCHAARKKPLEALTDEEIRCLIGQKTGLRYLLPIAVELLAGDPLREVTFYPGDLLHTLLRLAPEDWSEAPEALAAFRAMLTAGQEAIAACPEIPRALLEAYPAE